MKGAVRCGLGLAVAAALAFACSGDDEGGSTAEPVEHPGDAVFAANCASCHGADGSGGQGPPLADGVTVDKYSEAEMVALVTDGGDAMPAFGERLTAEEIADVVDFVRTGLTAGEDDDGTTTTAGDVERGSLSGVPPEAEVEGDWALPNGDYQAHRVAVESPIDSETVGDLEPFWTYEAPGGGTFGNFTTTPLIVGDTVFVGDLTTKVHAIDRETGEEKFVAGSEAGIFGPTGVAVGWGRLFGTTGDEDQRGTILVSYDAETGEELWRSDLGGNGGEINMQPVVYDGLVLVSTAGYGAGTRATIYAVDAETGDVVWDFPIIEDPDLWGHPELNSGGGAWYPPTVDVERGIAYVGTGNPYPFPGAPGPPGSPGFPNGSSRPGDNKWTDSLLALDIATGELVWGHQAIPHDIFDRDAMLSARVDVEIDGEPCELAISTGKLGVVFGLDADTGERLWRTEVGTHENDGLTEIDGPTLVYPGSLGGVQTPLAIDDGTIYMCVMNAPSMYEGPEETSFGFSVQLGTANSELVALDAATGEIDWTVELPGDALGGATVVNDLVFTASFSGEILAFDRVTGEEVWSYQAPGGINGWPAVAGDMLVVPVGMADPPKLLAFKLPEKD